MADQTKIEWTDATWNPITGCSVVSPGCTNCYAMRLAGTRLKHHESREGLTSDSKAGPVWNGKVRLNRGWLTQPRQWRRPRTIFVCAHGDLFAEGVPDDWIDEVFAIMAGSPQHTFQVLTKRPSRMRDYLLRFKPDGNGFVTRDGKDGFASKPVFVDDNWPIHNVWLGVSVEDQKRADERIPDLLATPAAIRFISAEPLLGPIDLMDLTIEDDRPGEQHIDALHCEEAIEDVEHEPWRDNTLDWVIVGGESGPGTRPMHPDWARSIRDQCATAGVPFFFKQWGEWVSVSEVAGDGPHFSFPDGATVRNIGKKTAGRILDGVEHDAMPEPEVRPC